MILVDPIRAADPVPLSAVSRPGSCDVEIWQAQLDAQPDETILQLQALLSSDERQRAAGYYFERDRRRFVISRGILRTLLGHQLGRNPAELRFSYGDHGKPALVTEADEPSIAFNVSHAEGLALFALTRRGEVGLDIEWVRDIPEWEHIAAMHFSPAEIARLARCAPAERSREFFKAWSRHEAGLKARGTGLGATPEPKPGAVLHVAEFEPAPGFVGALATTLAPDGLVHRRWSGLAPGGGLPDARSSQSDFTQFSSSSPNLL